MNTTPPAGSDAPGEGSAGDEPDASAATQHRGLPEPPELGASALPAGTYVATVATVGSTVSRSAPVTFVK